MLVKALQDVVSRRVQVKLCTRLLLLQQRPNLHGSALA